jgi:hypothetical protein
MQKAILFVKIKTLIPTDILVAQLELAIMSLSRLSVQIPESFTLIIVDVELQHFKMQYSEQEVIERKNKGKLNEN